MKRFFSVLFLLTVFVSTGFVKASELTCDTLMPLMSGFLSQHYSKKEFSSELEERTTNQFIKSLDPSKNYLLQSDVDDIRKNMSGIFTKLRAKDCAPIDNAYKVYRERVAESLALAKKSLGDQYKFDENVTLVIDPAKRKFASNKKELEDLQLRYLHFQIANYKSADMKLPDAKKQLVHRYEVFSKHSNDKKKDDVLAEYLDAFASALDPHSNFLSKDVLEDFEITMKLSLEGIGATLRFDDGYTVVDSLVPGGAADKSGEIQPKDKILAVGQGTSGKMDPVIDMPLRDVVKLIRGKKGTVVRLSILRQAKNVERITVTLTRDKIDLKDEAAKLSFVDKTVDGKKYKVAIVNLPSFYSDSEGGERSCSEDVKKLLKEAAAKKADALVLDLSKNGGGVLGEAVRVAGLFIKKGNVVSTKDSNGRVETLPDLDSSIYFPGPLVVLTSRLSASASEIVAGALRDYKRAIIVGSDRTFGKGSVQAVMKLKDDLGAIKVTTGMFFIPGGDSTQEKGVTADVRIPSPWMTKEMSEEALDFPLPKNSLPAFISPEANNSVGSARYTPVTDDLISSIQKSSKARVDKDPEFKKIETELKETESRQGVMKLADLVKKNAETTEKDKKAKKSKNRRVMDEAEYLNQPSVQEAVNVAIDLLKDQSSPAFANKDQKSAPN